ncbi:MAG: (2Fe-2S)-binding protein [Anaerolineales bacterium]
MTGKNQNFNIKVNGRTITACSGQTVAAAMMAAGIKVLRQTHKGAPRGLFCGMGVCFECRVSAAGIPEQRACMTPVFPGMEVELDFEVGDSHGGT